MNEFVKSNLETPAADTKATPLLAPELKDSLQKSYAEVRSALDALEPKSMGWEAKVRDTRRCGLVKAVCAAKGSYEWVEPKWAGDNC